MIDSITKKRIIVETDPKYGLYARVTDWEDKDFLEDVLIEQHDVDCNSYVPEKDDFGNEVAYRLYFGGKIEKAILQRIIDGVQTNDI